MLLFSYVLNNDTKVSISALTHSVNSNALWAVDKVRSCHNANETIFAFRIVKRAALRSSQIFKHFSNKVLDIYYDSGLVALSLWTMYKQKSQ